MSSKIDELIDALLALQNDKEFIRSHKKLKLEISVFDKGNDYVEMRFNTRFALYDVLISEDLHNTFNIRTGIIETAYSDIDDLIELGLDGTKLNESWFDVPDDDIEGAVEEIINQAFDDGTIEYMFKTLSKIKNTIEKFDDDGVFDNNHYVVGKFLMNFGIAYE